MSEFPITSPTGQDMLEQLPPYYEEIRETRVLVESEGKEFDDLKAAVNDVFDQYFVETGSWGLSRWEAEFGITPQAGQPDAQRRSVIRSRIRGIGTVTVSLIKTIAEAYDGGLVDVSMQPAEYKFTVKFIDTMGVPPNLDDLKAVIDEIKPAHLAVQYEFTYYLYSDLTGSGKTYGELTGYTYDQVYNRGLA